MRFKKIGVSAFTLALVSTLCIFPQSAQADPPQGIDNYNGGCGAVHIMTASGTGGSGRDKSNQSDYMMKWMVDAVQKTNPGKVTSYDIGYPSSAGALYSLIPTQDNSANYGLSRLEGDMNGLKHLKNYISNCPDSAVAFTGYSQGASVAGDLAALAANGAVPGLKQDKIIGAMLFADPGRSGASQYGGPKEGNKTWIPIPQNAIYQRNGEFSTAQNRKTIGWTGQRSLPFTGIEGRVISICNDSDLACAAAPGSAHRAIADFSDKDIWPNKSYREGLSLSQVAVRNPEMIGIFLDLLIKLAVNEDYDPVLNEIGQKVQNTKASPLEKGVAINAIHELQELLKILERPDMYGTGIPDRGKIAHILSIGWPTFKGEIDKFNPPPEVKTGIEVFVAAMGAFSGVPSDVNQRVEPMIRYIVNFPKEHAVYFGTEKSTINGQSAKDWGANALAQGVSNYLAQKSVTIQADGNNPGTGTEKAESDRLDDGLKAMLQFNEKGYHVLGEDTDDYPTFGVNDSSAKPEDQTPPTNSGSNSNTSVPTQPSSVPSTSSSGITPIISDTSSAETPTNKATGSSSSRTTASHGDAEESTNVMTPENKPTSSTTGYYSDSYSTTSSSSTTSAKPSARGAEVNTGGVSLRSIINIFR